MRFARARLRKVDPHLGSSMNNEGRGDSFYISRKGLCPRAPLLVGKPVPGALLEEGRRMTGSALRLEESRDGRCLLARRENIYQVGGSRGGVVAGSALRRDLAGSQKRALNVEFPR